MGVGGGGGIQYGTFSLFKLCFLTLTHFSQETLQKDNWQKCSERDQTPLVVAADLGLLCLH